MMQLLAGHVGGGDYLKKQYSYSRIEYCSLKSITIKYIP